MIVEPVPTHPRSRGRRAAARLGVALPVVLLAGVIGAGLFGSTVPPRGGTPAAQAGATSAGAVASPAAPGGAGGLMPLAVDDHPFPTAIDSLRVRSIADVLEARARGAPAGVIAVAGYLGVPQPPTGCGDVPLGPLGPLCVRMGLLAAAPWSSTGTGALSGIGPHLHVRVAAGVRLPGTIAGTMTAATGVPVPVVVIGRFEPLLPAGCSPVGIRCDTGFNLDAVGWLDGAPFVEEPVIDAGVDPNPVEWVLHNRRLAEAALASPKVTVLGSALLRPDSLAGIEPGAAAAISGRRAPAGLVWLVRGLDTGYDPIRYPLGQAPPRLVWVLVDDVTGTVLARGT